MSEKNILVRDMGRVHLKNIKEPERIFKIYSSQEEYDKETESELTKKLINKESATYMYIWFKELE